MAININRLKTDVRPIGNRVLVSDMYFGEQVTKGGIIISDDDKTTRGIYPRWGKVYKKGPDNNDDYKVGDWILVEHGRWTRGVDIDNGEEELTIRMVEAESVLAYSDVKPNDTQIGAEYADGEHATVDPSSFINNPV